MASRSATIASGIVAGVLGAAYGALTWDAWLTNFQVRWMCDEDRPFILLRRTNVAVLGVPDDIARGDAKVLAAFGPVYPEVVVPARGAAQRPRYEIVEKWPTVLRDYWGFRVVRTELSVIDHADRNRALATSSIFRRDERGPASWRDIRRPVVPPPERCAPSDRVEFVKNVLQPE